MTQTQTTPPVTRARPVGYQQDFEFTVSVANESCDGYRHSIATVDYLNAEGIPFLREKFGHNEHGFSDRLKNRLFLQAELNATGAYEGAYKEYHRGNGYLLIDSTKNAAGNFEGQYTEYCSWNGLRYIEGTINSKGCFEGRLQIFNRNNGLRDTVGTCNENGYFVGPFERYHESGHLKIEGTLSSKSTLTHDLLREVYFKDNVYDYQPCGHVWGACFIGAYNEYHKNGKRRVQATCNADGKFEGVRKTYHENGSISGIITTNAEGRKNGLCASYFENGNIYKKCMRKNGDKYGPFLFGSAEKPHRIVSYVNDHFGPALNLFPSINEVIEDSRIAAQDATKLKPQQNKP